NVPLKSIAFEYLVMRDSTHLPEVKTTVIGIGRSVELVQIERMPSELVVTADGSSLATDGLFYTLTVDVNRGRHHPNDASNALYLDGHATAVTELTAYDFQILK